MELKLTPDQLYVISRFETDEELMNYLSKEGIELSAKQLETISGGVALEGGETGLRKKCPVCGTMVLPNKLTLHMVLMHSDFSEAQ